MMSKTTQHTIVIKGVSHPYSLRDNGDGSTTMMCRDARLNQPFANEDLAETIRLLPEYIKAAQEFMAKQDDMIRFRIKGRDKQKIEKKARAAGVSLSTFIRERALA